MAELWRYRTLVKNLVMRGLKLKYRDSVIGVAWSLLLSSPAGHGH